MGLGLQNSGEISIGGLVSQRSINVELGLPYNWQSSLNDTAMRQLADKPSGSISFADFYGKRHRIIYVNFAVSSGTTITVPANAAVGDVAVLFDGADRVFNFSKVVPTNWTEINNSLNIQYTTWSWRVLSMKQLVAGDPGSTITGMSSTVAVTKMMLVFRSTGVDLTACYQADQVSDHSSGLMSSKIINASQSTPYVVLGGIMSSATPSWNGVWYDGQVANGLGNLAYQIKTDISSTILTMNDTGTGNSIQAFTMWFGWGGTVGF